MAYYHWVIALLIILNWVTYTYPDTATKVVGPVWDWVNDGINLDKWFNKAPTEDDNPCPDTFEPVCGEDGITYNNICDASMADVFKVTPGEC